MGGGLEKIMGNNIVKLRFVERYAIIIITGFLSYNFIINMQMAIFSYNPLGELILIALWGLTWMGTSSLIRKLLRQILN